MNAERIIAGQPRAHHGTGGEWAILCPFHYERTPSCYVNVQKRVFICHGCGEKGRLVKLIAKLQNISMREAAALAGEDSKFYAGDFAPGRLSLPAEFRTLPDGSSFGRAALEYLKSRRITQDQVVRHGIGFCTMGRFSFRVIVPVYLNGELVNFVARDWTGKAERKVRYPAGARAAEAIFAYDKALGYARTVVITEGWADALAVERVLMRDRFFNSWAAVAIGGKELTAEKRVLLSLAQFENFVILLDADAANDAARMQQQLGAFNGVSVRVARVTAKDPAEEREENLIRILR